MSQLVTWIPYMLLVTICHQKVGSFRSLKTSSQQHKQLKPTPFPWVFHCPKSSLLIALSIWSQLWSKLICFLKLEYEEWFPFYFFYYYYYLFLFFFVFVNVLHQAKVELSYQGNCCFKVLVLQTYSSIMAYPLIAIYFYCSGPWWLKISDDLAQFSYQHGIIVIDCVRFWSSCIGMTDDETIFYVTNESHMVSFF